MEWMFATAMPPTPLMIKEYLWLVGERMVRLLVRDMRKRMELKSVIEPSFEGGMVGRRELRQRPRGSPRPRPQPRGRREGVDQRELELGDGLMVVGGPGVRLIV